MDSRKILEAYPLPLARGYRRYINAAETRERHDNAYSLFEIYLKYCTSIAVSCYLAGPERDHRVNATLKGLARPSLGEWHRFLRECVRFLTQGKDPHPAISALAELLHKKQSSWGEVVVLYNAMRSFCTGTRSNKESTSLETLLCEVVRYRNRVIGHGAPLEAEHYRAFGGLFAEAFGDLLDRCPFLTALRLVSFDSIHVIAGSRVECGVIEFMGGNPVRKPSPHLIAYGRPVPAEKRLCLLSGDGEFISLDPLLVICGEDVYILNDAQGSPEYLSYSTGERFSPSNRDQAQEELFGRILGYPVDSSRLSRIGDDLAAAGDAFPGSPLREGERRLGDYRIVREIAHGAMGLVFEAIQESLGRRVALKVLPGTFALDSRRVERFHREARATARIHHPNIVPVYEVGEVDGHHYYAMEYVDGSSLEQLIAKRRVGVSVKKGWGSSSASDPVYIARSVEGIAALAEGLEVAHRQGIIHRDVKPSNILADPGGNFVLVDFGLVREEQAVTLTLSGEMVGTVNYMSPEQVSRRRVDARSDVYSLGVTLYEILTLRLPFEGKTEHEMQNAILFEDPTPPRRFNSRINRDLETILLCVLEKNPERRYASSGEFAADLRRFLRYEPIRARPSGLLRRGAKWFLRHRNSSAVGATILIFLLLLCGWWFYEGYRTARETLRWLREAESLFDRAAYAEARVAYQQALVLNRGNRTIEDRIADCEAQVRRTRALELEKAASVKAASYGELKARLRELHRRLAFLQEETPSWASLEIKKPLLETQDLQQDLQHQLEASFSEAFGGYTGALGLMPDLRSARQALANLAWVRFQEAEEGRDAGGVSYWGQIVKTYDDGTYAKTLEGKGSLTLVTRPEGADVHLFRYEERDLRMIPVPYHPGKGLREGYVDQINTRGPWVYFLVDGVEPGSSAERIGLSVGDKIVAACNGRPPTKEFLRTLGASHIRSGGTDFSYLGKHRLRILRGDREIPLNTMESAQGLSGSQVVEDAYPLLADDWNRLEGTTPLLSLSLPMGSYLLVLRRQGYRDTCYPVQIGRGEGRITPEIPLYTEEEIGEEYVYVPPGPFLMGGDPEALDSGEGRMESLPGFFLGKREVTTGEYLEFVNAEPRKLSHHVPRDLTGSSPSWKLQEGRYVLPPGWEASWPVMSISWEDAQAYVEWRTNKAQSDGEKAAYRLPSSKEWEKAARGVDGRWFPWGNRMDGRFAATGLSERWTGQTWPVGSFPTDASVYGILDLAGNVMEACQDWSEKDSQLRIFRGSSTMATSLKQIRCASFQALDPTSPGPRFGFRMVRVPVKE